MSWRWNPLCSFRAQAPLELLSFVVQKSSLRVRIQNDSVFDSSTDGVNDVRLGQRCLDICLDEYRVSRIADADQADQCSCGKVPSAGSCGVLRVRGLPLLISRVDDWLITVGWKDH